MHTRFQVVYALLAVVSTLILIRRGRHVRAAITGGGLGRRPSGAGDDGHRHSVRRRPEVRPHLGPHRCRPRSRPAWSACSGPTAPARRRCCVCRHGAHPELRGQLPVLGQIPPCTPNAPRSAAVSATSPRRSASRVGSAPSRSSTTSRCSRNGPSLPPPRRGPQGARPGRPVRLFGQTDPGLSGGQRRRLALAQALIGSPPRPRAGRADHRRRPRAAGRAAGGAGRGGPHVHRGAVDPSDRGRRRHVRAGRRPRRRPRPV